LTRRLWNLLVGISSMAIFLHKKENSEGDSKILLSEASMSKGVALFELSQKFGCEDRLALHKRVCTYFQQSLEIGIKLKNNYVIYQTVAYIWKSYTKIKDPSNSWTDVLQISFQNMNNLRSNDLTSSFLVKCVYLTFWTGIAYVDLILRDPEFQSPPVVGDKTIQNRNGKPSLTQSATGNLKCCEEICKMLVDLKIESIQSKLWLTN
ncbi:hypothetical protein HK096_010463, partial [Nowakowskiella sp. JEL0078]